MANNEDIKEAALRLFALKGYEGTTMQDIAQAVGLKKQSLYSHISGKEELYLSVLCDQTKIIMSEIQASIERLKEESPEALLKGLFQSLISVFSCRERLLLWKRTFIYFGSNPKSSAGSDMDWHIDSKIRDLLYHVIQVKHYKLSHPSRFRTFFISYMLTVQGYLDWLVVMGHQEEVFQTVWDNLWDGIGQYFQAS